MSVKFTPGPHPATKQRSASSTSLHTRQPSTNPPFQPDSPLTSPPRQLTNSNFPAVEDPERQPLIPTGQLNRRSMFYPVLMGVSAFIVVGLIVGLGGWRLGMGEGGRRWPGGPH